MRVKSNVIDSDTLDSMLSESANIEDKEERLFGDGEIGQIEQGKKIDLHAKAEK